MQARNIATLALLVVLPALPSCSKKGGFGANFEGALTMHITGQGPDSDIVLKTKDDKMRFETAKGYMLYDPKPNKVWMIDDASKTYFDMDFSGPNSPQANTSSGSATLDKNGKKETIAGVECTNWTAKDPSGRRSEVCIAEGIAFFDLDRLTSHGSNALGKEMTEKRLFPLRDVEYDETGKEKSRMEVTKVEKKKLEDAEFVLPKDYAKATLPGLH